MCLLICVYLVLSKKLSSWKQATRVSVFTSVLTFMASVSSRFAPWPLLMRSCKIEAILNRFVLKLISFCVSVIVYVMYNNNVISTVDLPVTSVEFVLPVACKVKPGSFRPAALICTTSLLLYCPRLQRRWKWRLLPYLLKSYILCRCSGSDCFQSKHRKIRHAEGVKNKPVGLGWTALKKSWLRLINMMIRLVMFTVQLLICG